MSKALKTSSHQTLNVHLGTNLRHTIGWQRYVITIYNFYFKDTVMEEILTKKWKISEKISQIWVDKIDY